MDFTALFQLQLMMFALMGLGFYLRRRDIIDARGKAAFTDLIIDVVLPCNIINSFCIEFDGALLLSCIQIFAASVLLQVFCYVLARTLYNRQPDGRRAVLQYCTLISNAGFLGNSLVEGLYGSMGLLYASFYLIPQRIMMWTAGISYFAAGTDRRGAMRKILMHPCIIATEIGIVLMLTQLELPAAVSETVRTLAACTTPLTMIVTGTVLAEAGLRNMINKTTVFYSLVRLVIIPAAVLAGCRLCGVNELAAGVAVVLAAMPAGSTTAILAAKYNSDAAFASQCIVLTTLLSMALLPLWCTVLSFVF